MEKKQLISNQTTVPMSSNQDEISESSGSKSVMVDEQLETDPIFSHFAESAPLLSFDNVHFPTHWRPEEILFVGAFGTGIRFYDSKYDEYFEFSTRQHRKRIKTFRIGFPFKARYRAGAPFKEIISHSSFYLAFFFLVGSVFFLTAEVLSYQQGPNDVIVILQFIKGVFFLVGACFGFIEVIDAPALVNLESEFKARIHYYRKLHLPFKAKAKHVLANTRRFANFSLHQVGFWSASYLLSAVVLLAINDYARFILFEMDKVDVNLLYNLKVMTFVGAILLLLSNVFKFLEITHFLKKPLLYNSFGYWGIVCFIILSVALIIGEANVLFGFMSLVGQGISLITCAAFAILGSALLLLELRLS